MIQAITNKHKLPKTVVQAIKQVRDDYDSGGSNISASGITIPPRIYWLTKRYRNEIVEDAADLIWSLIGTAVHFVLEKSAEYVNGARAEERLFKEVLGWVFSGKYDLVEGKKLIDYKITSVGSVLKDEPKFEWVAQGNVNRLLLHEHGVEIDSIEIVAILRDWVKSKAKADKSYPQVQVKRIKIPVWSLEETEKFLLERVALLQSYENTPDDDLPLCTDEERWRDPTKWAVMKKGGKRAVKVYDTEFDAKVHASNIEGGYVEERKGSDKRCLDYCQVCTKCSYWKENYGSK